MGWAERTLWPAWGATMPSTAGRGTTPSSAAKATTRCTAPRGQEGADLVYGEAGDDWLEGGDGDDILRGHDGVDRCDGGPGRDDAATCEQFVATEVGQVPTPRVRPGPTQVALTFDDGPSPAYTRRILDILEEYGVPATFFVIGRSAAENPELLERMAADGHSVQNHTYSHYWLTRYPDATITDQLARANQVIEELTGETPNCYRPPFGAVNDRVRSLAADLGLATIMWDVDPWDWKHPGTSAVASHVLSRTTGGDIVLFHDTAGWSTIGALPAIIQGLRARGLEFVTICSDPANTLGQRNYTLSAGSRAQ
jgi:peptidoglycan/xylan/chitin deacetylase (PgdA/CDA1 family)